MLINILTECMGFSALRSCSLKKSLKLKHVPQDILVNHASNARLEDLVKDVPANVL